MTAPKVKETMRFVSLVFVLVAAPLITLAQGQQDSSIETVVRECEPKRQKASVLFRSLVTSEGRLVKFDAESFYLKKHRKYFRSFYRDVLEIECGGKSASNVPDPSARAHGAWSDINQVYAGTKILVVLTDGKSLKGFSNSATESALVIVDANGRERIDIPRDRVVAFYGLLGGYGGVKKGASKGAEGLSTGSRDKLPGLVFAGVGALVGLVKSDGRPVLIYSK
jgi:hypothetical protein